MKKNYLIISATALLALASCSALNPSGGNKSPLTLYDENAKFVLSGYANGEWFPLATYHHKNNGEAPYVEIGQFLEVINNLIHIEINYETMTSNRLYQYDSYINKIDNHLYGIFSENVIGATIDTEDNILNILRFDYMFAQNNSFNGSLRNDTASPNNSDLSLVHGTNRSKYYGEFESEAYDLDDYHMDIVEKDNKVYMPAQFLSNTFLRGQGFDIVYNGNDFFTSSAISNNSYPNVTSSYYSSNNTFKMDEVLYSSVTPTSGEQYRYVASLPTEPVTYGIFSLDKEGHGYAYTASSKSSTEPSDVKYKLDWQKVNDDIYVTLYNKDSNGQFANAGKIMRISTKETFFNKKTRSTALAEFNYQLLRFQIDNYYGLKEELSQKQGYVDFDSFVSEKGLKDKLMSLDTREYDEGLSEFLMKYIDDGHTRYNTRSVFSGMESVSGADLATRYTGPRVNSLFNYLSDYTTLRKNTLGENVEPQGLFMEDNTAVIRFDAFNQPLPIIFNPGSYLDNVDVATALKTSSPFGFIKAFAEIEKHDEIKNVVIDLTCNRGGAVLTLPFLTAYFSKDPILVLKDNLGGVVREFHYDVDLNMDGIYRGPGDYYGDKYHFYILTSEFSFSCASALPTMAKIANVDIIGAQSGGGACNVAGFTDACGSIYNLSAPQQIGYLDEQGNFINDDAGIAVTHELAKDSWYDMVKLNAAINSFAV